MRMNRAFRKRASVTGMAGLAVLTVAGITACGEGTSGAGNSTGGTSGDVTISVYVGADTLDAQAQKDLFNKALIPEFEKQNPGIQVKWSTYASSSEENTSLQTAVTTHQGPDVFEVGTTLVPTVFSTNAFHVLTDADWNAVGGKSKFFAPQLTMSGPSADKDVAIPEYMLPFALVYNKKLFKEAGISSPPTTWTEFVNDATKLTDAGKDQWGTEIDPADSYDPWKINWGYTRQDGGDFLSHDLKTATLDSQPSVNALTFWFDWITKYHIASPNDVTYKSTDAIKAFENGHVAMLVMQGLTLIPSLNQSAVKSDYAFAPLPTVPYGMSARPTGGVPAQTIVSGQDLAIPNYVTGAKYDAALKWIKFVTDPKQQKEFYDVYGYLPVNQSVYGQYKELQTPLIQSFVDAEKNASPTPFTGAWGNLEVVYAGVTNKIADEIATNSFQEGDIAQLLKVANTQVQASLQN